MALEVLRGKGAERALRSSLRPNGLHSCHAMQSVCDSVPVRASKSLPTPAG